MPFHKKGFFGDDAKKLSESTRKKYAAWMQACRDLNEVAHDLLPECKLISNDLVKLTAVSLFLRVISSFSAAVKLFEAGIYQDAGTVLRSEVESAIFLKAVATKDGFVEKFHYASEIPRLTIINISLAGEAGAVTVDDTNRELLKQKKAEIDALVADGTVKDLKVRTVANDVGLLEIYNTAYRLLSNVSVHTSSRSLQGYFRYENNEPKAVLWPPQEEDYNHLGFTACSALVTSIETMTKLFALDEKLASVQKEKLDAVIALLQKNLPKKSGTSGAIPAT